MHQLALIDLKNRLIQVKIVYYGPGRGGKTTNLEYIYGKYQKNINSQLISIKTQGDRTLFFDFLPFNMGQIRGFDIRIQLYTVPGQVKYNATRKLVLNGVDGLVFVADSSEACRRKNINSLENLKDNLSEYHKNIHDLPLVIQYNKRDLSENGTPVLDLETLDQDLNGELKVPTYPAVAVTGENVVLTLREIITRTVASLEEELA